MLDILVVAADLLPKPDIPLSGHSTPKFRRY